VSKHKFAVIVSRATAEPDSISRLNLILVEAKNGLGAIARAQDLVGDKRDPESKWQYHYLSVPLKRFEDGAVYGSRDCTACGGSGYADYAAVPCDTCGGTGEIYVS
jgi:hypothetical protein